MIKAFIVDDESLAREGIRLMLKKETDVEVIGEAFVASLTAHRVRSAHACE